MKILFLTLVILGFFETYAYVSGDKNQISDLKSTKNQDVFYSSKVQSLGSVSIAVTTSVGDTGHSQDNSKLISNLTYTGVENIGNSESQRTLQRKNMIYTNMSIIQEYLALSKTDIVSLLAQSSQRKNTIESFISQLEIRYKNAALSVVSLGDHQVKLSTNIEQIQSQIESVKQKMNEDFSSFKNDESVRDIEEYLELKREYQSNYVDIIYINQFTKQYIFLSEYNKKLLDTLINNKEALISQSFVVIPSSGDDLLRDFNLIYDEEGYKAKISEVSKK